MTAIQMIITIFMWNISVAGFGRPTWRVWCQVNDLTYALRAFAAAFSSLSLCPLSAAVTTLTLDMGGALIRELVHCRVLRLLEHCLADSIPKRNTGQTVENLYGRAIVETLSRTIVQHRLRVCKFTPR